MTISVDINSGCGFTCVPLVTPFSKSYVQAWLAKVHSNSPDPTTYFPNATAPTNI